MIGRMVEKDASLTYRLLRIVNSPLYGMSRAVTSVEGALLMVGDDMFRRIATVAIAGHLEGNQPSELLFAAFVRGRFCEQAAERMGQDAKEQYLLGILSLLPPLMSVAMSTIVDSVPLREELRRALLGENNRERTALELLLCYEAGDWEVCDCLAERAGIAHREIPELYDAALEWARKNIQLVG